MNVLRQKKVKTRKTHKCFGCGREFKKGSILTNLVHTDQSEIQSNYWCEVCRIYWNRHMHYDDTIFFGELKSEDENRWDAIRKEVEENNKKEEENN